GSDKVAFRFQVDPDTSNPTNQAFMDALDTTPATKPYLTINTAVLPCDSDGDGDVDLVDYAAFVPCISGPSTVAAPGCGIFDVDADSDVDLRDFGSFQYYLGVTHP
ncbi:MAG: hypothetical protein V2A79_02080, partial [Planctomycetota bacterium]